MASKRGRGALVQTLLAMCRNRGHIGGGDPCHVRRQATLLPAAGAWVAGSGVAGRPAPRAGCPCPALAAHSHLNTGAWKRSLSRANHSSSLLAGRLT